MKMFWKKKKEENKREDSEPKYIQIQGIFYRRDDGLLCYESCGSRLQTIYKPIKKILSEITKERFAELIVENDVHRCKELEDELIKNFKEVQEVNKAIQKEERRILNKLKKNIVKKRYGLEKDKKTN